MIRGLILFSYPPPNIFLKILPSSLFLPKGPPKPCLKGPCLFRRPVPICLTKFSSKNLISQLLFCLSYSLYLERYSMQSLTPSQEVVGLSLSYSEGKKILSFSKLRFSSGISSTNLFTMLLQGIMKIMPPITMATQLGVDITWISLNIEHQKKLPRAQSKPPKLTI